MKRRLFLLVTPAIVAAPSLMRVSTAALGPPMWTVPPAPKLWWSRVPVAEIPPGFVPWFAFDEAEELDARALAILSAAWRSPT